MSDKNFKLDVKCFINLRKIKIEIMGICKNQNPLRQYKSKVDILCYDESLVDLEIKWQIDSQKDLMSVLRNFKYTSFKSITIFYIQHLKPIEKSFTI